MSTPTEEGIAANPFPPCFGTYVALASEDVERTCNTCSVASPCMETEMIVRRSRIEAVRRVPLSEPDTPPSKYHRLLKRKLPSGAVVQVWVDVYDVLDLFKVTNPADQHALKKMLVPGKRGHKDENTDRDEAIWSLKRARELEEHRNA